MSKTREQELADKAIAERGRAAAIRRVTADLKALDDGSRIRVDARADALRRRDITDGIRPMAAHRYLAEALSDVSREDATPRGRSKPKEGAGPVTETKTAVPAAKPRKTRPAAKGKVTVAIPEAVVPEGTKTCPTCQTVKPLTEFYPKRTGKAEAKPRGECRPCYNARWREWDAARRAKKAAEGGT